jgi:hypothetical protein
MTFLFRNHFSMHPRKMFGTATSSTRTKACPHIQFRRLSALARMWQISLLLIGVVKIITGLQTWRAEMKKARIASRPLVTTGCTGNMNTWFGKRRTKLIFVRQLELKPKNRGMYSNSSALKQKQSFDSFRCRTFSRPELSTKRRRVVDAAQYCDATFPSTPWSNSSMQENWHTLSFSAAATKGMEAPPEDCSRSRRQQEILDSSLWSPGRSLPNVPARPDSEYPTVSAPAH